MTAPMTRKELFHILASAIELGHLGDNWDMLEISEEDHAHLPALLRGDAQTSGWQPIETAPKDGTFLVCAVGDDRGAFVVSGEILAMARKANTPSHLGLGYVTHWMPLPAPPSNQGASK